MGAKLIKCGEFANESERMAAQRCKVVFDSLGDSVSWVVLTNLASSSSPLHQSDELDLVCIGPRGCFLIEVKHWDAGWLRENGPRAEDEAEKLAAKTRRLAGRVRLALANAPKVEQRFLLTKEPVGANLPEALRGAPLLTFRDLQAEFRGQPLGVLSEVQVSVLAQALQPLVKVHLDGKVRQIGSYRNLELQTPPSERFHRVYRGVHQRTKEKVALHLYDPTFRRSGTRFLPPPLAGIPGSAVGEGRSGQAC